MRSILSIILCIPGFIYSQEYFLLDSLKKDFKVNEYVLNTQDIYNINKDINIYNIFVSENKILLLSVLPDLDEEILPRMNEKGQNWEVIGYDKIKNNLFSKNKIQNMLQEWQLNSSPENKTLKYKLVKKEGETYYVSKVCLTESFNITDLTFPLISSYGTINVSEPKISIRQMREVFKNQIPNEEFIMDVRNNNLLRKTDVPYSFRNYLSKEYNVKGNKAYQFWTFDGWWVQDGYNEHRGIDRFLYIQGKGIVGGSYDFYFRFRPKTSSEKYFTISNNALWNNIINEKIMVAREVR